MAFKPILSTKQAPAFRPSGWKRIGLAVLYVLALTLLLLAPVLGLAVGAVGAWHAILAGSIFYLPIGVLLMLVGLSVYQCHRKRDIATLALLAAAVSGWFLVDLTTRNKMQEWAVGLILPVELLAGLLALLVLLLAVLLAWRLFADRAPPIKALDR